MQAVRQSLDETIHSVSSRWPGCVGVHHLYECNDYRACEQELGSAYDANVFLVRYSHLFFPRSVVDSANSRYFSLFVIYTPYTIYQCAFISSILDLYGVLIFL